MAKTRNFENIQDADESTSFVVSFKVSEAKGLGVTSGNKQEAKNKIRAKLGLGPYVPRHISTKNPEYARLRKELGLGERAPVSSIMKALIEQKKV